MEDMDMDGAFEPVAVELVAQGVIGKRVDEMESGFLMALDYMIQLAQKDADDEVLDRVIVSLSRCTGILSIYYFFSSLQVVHSFCYVY
jgi:HKD family nuclease